MKEIFTTWSSYLVPWIVAHGIRIVVIMFGAYILNIVLKRFIEKVVHITIVPDNDPTRVSEKKREETLIRIFSWTMTIVITITATMMVLDEAGVPIGPILAGAGILGIAVGFGGQYLIRDLISGFFIILENQYRIGDIVNFDGTGGLVEDISLRVTTLRDLDGTVHHVPHGEIKRVSNLSKNFSRINLNLGIAYDSPLEDVIRVINETGSELANDPVWKDHIIKAPQFLRVEDFTDTAIMIKILGETQPHKKWEIAGELRKRIKIAFDKAGIEMPFGQRFLHQVASQNVQRSEE
ncbi:MAG: mechanosensitive ion channel family protein [Bacteroidota bacterium]|nr:mechanosensitive ion channel family protein [Bacteroidota bacterium]